MMTSSLAPPLLCSILLALLACGSPLFADVNADTKSSADDEKQIVAALKSYYADYGAFPAAGADICGVLTGANPRQVIFIVFPARSIDAKGRFLDAWGTPYEIKITGPKSFEIRSAGPNKQPGTKDDIVFTDTIK